jgi:hypothetical protein
MTDLEFVNDWSELEAAVNLLKTHELLDYEYCECDQPCNGGHAYMPYGVEDAVATIVEYVPRLLTQYAKLVELSFALTEGWEQYVTLQGPSGLYVPDNR